MEKTIFKATALALLVFSMFTGAMLVPATLQTTGVVDDAPNFFITVKAADDTSPGDGDCGVVNVYVMDASLGEGAIDTRDIAEEDADVWSHLPADEGFSDGVTLSDTIPYNDDFIVVVEAMYNYTVAYNVSATGWDTDYVSASFSSSDITVGSTDEGNDFYDKGSAAEGQTSKINFWIDNSDEGWSIAHGESVSITITLNGYW